MPPPETIHVKYTEEDAEFISVRPVMRQTFRIEQLLEMVLTVTGKDLARIQQIVRSGTVVYNFYRYWWDGFETPPEEMARLLATFPDADPSRAFSSEACRAVRIEAGGTQGSPGWQHPDRRIVEVTREAGATRRLFRRQTFWDCLMEVARQEPPPYQTYSYARRADLYACELSAAARERLEENADRLAAHSLRAQLHALAEIAGSARLIYICVR